MRWNIGVNVKNDNNSKIIRYDITANLESIARAKAVNKAFLEEHAQSVSIESVKEVTD